MNDNLSHGSERKISLIVANALENLEIEMLEAKKIWYSNGKKEEWDKMWGITGRHRYEDTRKRLVELKESYRE